MALLSQAFFPYYKHLIKKNPYILFVRCYCILNFPLSHPCSFSVISDWSIEKEWVIIRSLFKTFIAMHSFSLFLNYHLPEVDVSGLCFSAKVESKQTTKVSVIAEHKGQKVKSVGSIHSHFLFFLFILLNNFSHVSKDCLTFHTEAWINPFVMPNLLQYYQVERQGVFVSFNFVCCTNKEVYDP